MVTNIIKNWSIIRAIRLMLGVTILIQAIIYGDKIMMLFGGLFSLMPLLNIGCCGASICNTQFKEKSINKEFIYDEVK